MSQIFNNVRWQISLVCAILALDVVGEDFRGNYGNGCYDLQIKLDQNLESKVKGGGTSA